jgi:hypothetical protein
MSSVETFHQPFGDLPVDCEAVEQQVRQVRICIEVLRSYLGRRPLPDAAKEAALAKAEKQYLVDAYTMLLNRIGTSYEEVRLARTAKVEERKALAERLGISLTVPRPDPKTTMGDELDQLFLDPEATSPSVRALTETALERLFGLADTTRDPLSEGVKLGDDPDPAKALVTRWNLDGAVWNKNTDEDGKVYLTISQNNGLARVEVFRDAAWKELVADSNPNQKAAAEPVRATPRKGSGLSGTFVVIPKAASSTIEIAAIPKFLCWRLKNLRKLCREQQDHPEDAYADGQSVAELKALPTNVALPSLSSGIIAHDRFNGLLMFTGVMSQQDRTKLLGLPGDTSFQAAVNELFIESQRPPIIDPDIIGPDDFRMPVAKSNPTSPDRAFDIWLRRRKWVDTTMADLKTAREKADATSRNTGLTAILQQVFGSPLPDLDKLSSNLATGTDIDKTKFEIKALHLTDESFRRLVEIRAKDRLAAGNDPRNAQVSDEEWADVYSILTQAEKRKQFAEWRNEEATAGVRMGLDEFWFSLREPMEGDWPLVPVKDHPFIDPDIVKPADLPEPTAGAAAKTLWDARRKELDEFPAKLKAERESNGFDRMLSLAFGPPNTGRQWRQDLNQLKTDLASTNQNVVKDAKEKITANLRLTEKSFWRLMAIEAKDAKPKPEDKPTTAEYAEVYTILANASKFKLKYPKWIGEEQQASLNTNYWQALKARLPKWRVSAEARQAWRQALAVRTKDPIIDPDLIDFEDLRKPLAGKAFETLRDRAKWLNDQRDLLEKTRGPASLNGFNAIVKDALGIDGQVLVTLAEENKQGHSIEARLEQLNLTNASFSYLLRVRDLAANQQPIIASEWEAVYSILVQAQKKRCYAAWREEERIAGIMLSPDHFAIPAPTAITFPPPQPRKFDPWRASWVAHRDWQDILQSRIDQENGVIAGMPEAISATEEAVMPLLRDTLADRSAYFGTDLDERATWLTGRLFIDAKADGCQKTTRVAQAIETLQDLLMAARTGQLRRNFTEVKQIPGWFGSENQGGDIAVADINRDGGRPDHVVFHIDKRGGGNVGYYRIGWNLDRYGNVTHWTWTDTPDPAFQVQDPNTNSPATLGDENQGAGIAIADINRNGLPDIVIFYVQHSTSGNKGFYRIGWDLDSSGKATSWSPEFDLPTVQLPDEIQGVAIAIADVTGTGKRDLVIFYIDSMDRKAPDNHGYYHIGWNLDANGKVTGSWSPPKDVPHLFSWENQGAGIAIADINGDGKNDLLVFYIDNPPDENSGLYRVGYQLNASGDVVGGWSNENQPPMQVPGWFGHETQGAGVAVTDISGNGRPNLVVFHIDKARGENVGYYRIGWEIAAPNLGLKAKHFDEEWKWIGSYATWRAAMFVFLYPENILHPSLHRPQTSAFKTLVDNLRSNRLPNKACHEAKLYADYFRDICSLTLEATCQTKTLIHRGDECHTVEADKRPLFYMFGLAASSGKVYWSAYDPLDESDYAQTFWKEVPSFKGKQVVRIIGAIPTDSRAGSSSVALLTVNLEDEVTAPVKRFIYLFAVVLENGTQKLVLVKFNLEQYGLDSAWDQLKPIQDNLPGGGPLSSLTVLPVQTAQDTDRPRLALHKHGTGEVFVRGILEDGQWVESQSTWNSFTQARVGRYEYLNGVVSNFGPLYVITQLHAVIQADQHLWFCYTNQRGNFGVDVRGGQVAPTWTFETTTFLGALPSINSSISRFGSSSQIHVFYQRGGARSGGRTSGGLGRRATGGGFALKGTFQQVLGTQNWQFTGTPHRTYSDLAKVVTHSGDKFDSHTVFAYQRGARFNYADSYVAKYKESGDQLVEFQTTRATPRVSAPLEIPDRLDSVALRDRRQLIKQAFEANQDAYTSKPQWMWIMTYLHEAYYFVPLHLAMQLQAPGYYVEALDWFRTIYDYQAPVNERQIYYGLELDAKQSDDQRYKRAASWLLDPLDPHRIASTRRYAYTRFTLMSLKRCLLDFADSEFTRDTPESLPKARTLYTTALELSDLPELKQQLDMCEKKIGDLVIEIGEDIPENMQPTVRVIVEGLNAIVDRQSLAPVLANVKAALTADKDWASRLNDARSLVEEAVARNTESLTIGSVLGRKTQFEHWAYSNLLREPSIERATQNSADVAGLDFLNGVAAVTGISAPSLEKEKIDLPWLRLIPRDVAGSASSVGTSPIGSTATVSPMSLGLTSLDDFELVSVSAATRVSPPIPEKLAKYEQGNLITLPSIEFCIPPNPILRSLRLRAEINLHKLRTCRNIAGMRRQLEPYAAPTDTTSGLPTVGAGGQLILPGISSFRPTLYRYSALIERAKQLVQIAAQIEGQMLSALEKRDAEHYSLLRARQELGLAQAGVRLQDLRVKEAEGSVRLAELQQERAQIQIDTYEDWLQKGLNQFENEMIKAHQDAAAAQKGAQLASLRLQLRAALGNSIQVAQQLAQIPVAGGPLAFLGGVGNLMAEGYLLSEMSQDTARAIDATLAAQKASINAAHERRKDEWQLQKKLAEQDHKIGEQQEQIAKDHVEVVKQEKEIEQIKVNNANEGIAFLTNKFTNEELYDWMSGVLEDVYRSFLQQATTMAKLAENQLAFERQEIPPAFIQAD